MKKTGKIEKALSLALKSETNLARSKIMILLAHWIQICGRINTFYYASTDP